MLLFSADKLAQTKYGHDIFKGISFELNRGEKAAIVGPNGVGKTTLLRILAKIDQPAGGRLTFFAPVTHGILTQEFSLPLGLTVREVIEAMIDRRTGFSAAEILGRFNFKNAAGLPVDKLSGGEKTRLQLARLWVNQPDFLLLDEPTNHLDTDQLDWLEEFVNDYPGTVILVSHDRYFLDRTVSRVFELSPQEIKEFPGNFSAYYQAKQEQFQHDLKTYADQERQANRLDAIIRDKSEWGKQAHDRARDKAVALGLKKGGKEHYRAKAKKIDQQVKNTVKRLKRLEQERIERPHAAETIRLDFAARDRRRNALVSGENIAKSYDRPIFRNLDFTVQPGQKIALIGPNGAGKTTLLRIILGLEETTEGVLWVSPTLKTGYLEQEMAALGAGAHPERSVFEEVGSVSRDREKIFSLLAGLLIRRDDLKKPCSVLSMGEKVRVALAKLLLQPYDLLVLDEPTNYLDLESRQRIEDALTEFRGSIIVVSHDRYFLERVCNTVWDLNAMRLNIFPGRYSEYRDRYKNGPAQSGDENGLEETRLELELKKIQLLSEMSLVKNSPPSEEYSRLEQEFYRIMGKLHGMK